jgi:hypothetical protein
MARRQCTNTAEGAEPPLCSKLCCSGDRSAPFRASPCIIDGHCGVLPESPRVRVEPRQTAQFARGMMERAKGLEPSTFSLGS